MAAKVTGADKTLAATVTVGTPKSDTEKDICKLASPLVGEVTGALTLNATYVTSANSPLAIDMQSSTGNMGLLVNTLAEGASLTLAGLALPDKLDGTPLSTRQPLMPTRGVLSARRGRVPPSPYQLASMSRR